MASAYVIEVRENGERVGYVGSIVGGGNQTRPGKTTLVTLGSPIVDDIDEAHRYPARYAAEVAATGFRDHPLPAGWTLEVVEVPDA